MTSLTLRVILLAFSFFAISCSLFEPTSEPQVVGPLTRVYFASYDEVWRATQKALVRYPIQVNNIDLGLIETDIIKGEPVWQSPIKSKLNKVNAKYQLQVNFAKGKSRDKDSVRVTVQKSILLEKDFFSGEKKMASDGYEELALLYRIEREMALERSLKRAFEKKQI